MSLVASLLARLPLTGIQTALLAEPMITGLLPWDGVLASLSCAEELGLEYETFENCDRGAHAEHLRAASADSRGSALLPNLKKLRVWEWWHAHSVPPLAERRPLSTLDHVARVLTSRSQSASSSSGLEESLTVQYDVLGVHKYNSSVCLCGEIGTHPGPGTSRFKSWFMSRASCLRRTFQRNA